MAANESPTVLDARPWGREDYLKWFEAFLSQSKMSASAFGWDALKDPGFIGKLRAGERDVMLGTLEKAASFARKHMVQMEAETL